MTLKFPNFTILKASAGSGKTYEICNRFVQLLLSHEVSNNDLINLLAITFSNNSAKEMKERILELLKKAALSDFEALKRLEMILDLKDHKLIAEKASIAVDNIFDNYSDFQVKTIDSFMTTVYKASAFDFGYNPDFEIMMSIDKTIEYAFNVFLKNIPEDKRKTSLIEKLIDLIQSDRDNNSSYLWDPSRQLLDEIKELYRKISAIDGEIDRQDYTEMMQKTFDVIKKECNTIIKLANDNKLEFNKNTNFLDICASINNNYPQEILSLTAQRCPVNKPKNKSLLSSHENIEEKWKYLRELVGKYTELYCLNYYQPYIKTYEIFSSHLANLKKLLNVLFINDITKDLSSYLDNSIIPDVYFRLGDKIYHFMIDEFQDTSPVQWKCLYPLLENSLAQSGSLFIVGDTKQAIYKFRNSDYKIMKSLETNNPFKSAEFTIKDLQTNYRSNGEIVRFNKEIFKEKLSKNEDYKMASGQSGLNNFVQNARENIDNQGFVQVILLDSNSDLNEKEELIKTLDDIKNRGYPYKDITIITQKNSTVVEISSWLNEKDIPFISFSSLDIRKRPVINSIILLLKFLNSPSDNLSFACVIRSKLFLDLSGYTIDDIDNFLLKETKADYLYKRFQETFKDDWNKYFEYLFNSVGYLPLYDLVTEIMRIYNIFEHFKEEDSALIKFLEIINSFEGEGFSSIEDLIETIQKDDSDTSLWDVTPPKGFDAVNVMTIHKSKGLGFPVVIVLLYDEIKKGFKFIVESKNGNNKLYKINSKHAKQSDKLQKLYDQEELDYLVDKLNNLYVSFTRPEKELYVISVKKDKYKFPSSILQPDYKEGNKHKKTKDTTDAAQRVNLSYKICALKLQNTQLVLNMKEKTRGEVIHQILSRLDFIDDKIDDKITLAIDEIKQIRKFAIDKDKISEIIKKVFSIDGLRQLFEPINNRQVFTEKEFCDSQGRLFRIDRLVIDRDKIKVIEFKTGDMHDSHKEQIKNYLQVIKPIFNKELEGLLVYIDKNIIKKVLCQ